MISERYCPPGTLCEQQPTESPSSKRQYRLAQYGFDRSIERRRNLERGLFCNHKPGRDSSLANEIRSNNSVLLVAALEAD